ncbi:MAG: hypothetical protein ACI9K2_003271 [Myxococcota bacterium]|jgi:hypothetical protein
MSALAEQLAEARARWAARTPGRDSPSWLRYTQPEWAVSDGDASASWHRLPALEARAEVWWGHVLMANEALWQPGAGIAPGSILLSFDRYVQRNPRWYGDLAATRCWRLRGEEPAPPGLQSHVARMVDDVAREPRWRLPVGLSEGRAVYDCWVMIRRIDLPTGILRHHRVPVLACRDASPPDAVILPLHYWPTALRRLWEDAAAKG